jgi:hypothetical protein
MTPEEIQALITSTVENVLGGALKSSFEEIRTFVSDEINTAISAPKEAPVDPTDTSDSALMARITKLENTNQELVQVNLQKEQAEKELRFHSTLGEALGSKDNLIHTNVVKELLANRLAKGSVEKDGKWYTSNGSLLTEEVDSFLATDTGSHFIRSDHSNGQSTPSSKSKDTTPAASVSRSDVSLDDMLEGW